MACHPRPDSMIQSSLLGTVAGFQEPLPRGPGPTLVTIGSKQPALAAVYRQDNLEPFFVPLPTAYSGRACKCNVVWYSPYIVGIGSAILELAGCSTLESVKGRMSSGPISSLK
ncbi:uncharacterized protein ATNIH1004_004102 [Aspergillus tanneri]|uniref:Uncharacterized protein n=1 Tax=Aspergillus tanneri TaxID=1220188 RepID=A0A5M9MUC4_9EURO|nr:uncharacterized protein ATNIH1004_004102 [Aspergillus tanneri]KAA8648219.1 hypothetical protein ATNIH1004_004102 [Aspergillus tanneri]